jgi:hypothetical protein
MPKARQHQVQPQHAQEGAFTGAIRSRNEGALPPQRDRQPGRGGQQRVDAVLDLDPVLLRALGSAPGAGCRQVARQRMSASRDAQCSQQARRKARSRNTIAFVLK